MILMREMTCEARCCGGDSTGLQHAVDAVADAQLVFHRLDMDVGGARSRPRG